jgi:hypothetical protein
VDLYTLRPEGDWTIHAADGLNDATELPGVGCQLALSDF